MMGVAVRFLASRLGAFWGNYEAVVWRLSYDNMEVRSHVMQDDVHICSLIHSQLSMLQYQSLSTRARIVICIAFYIPHHLFAWLNLLPVYVTHLHALDASS